MQRRCLRLIVHMSGQYSRRAILGGLLGTCASAGFAGAPTVSLRPVARPVGVTAASAPGAQALIDSAKLGGDLAFSVVDVRTGRVLEALDEKGGHPPASVAKAVTALYALDVLGPKFRFETRLLSTGKIQDGVLNGDLILAGGGDPTLDTNGLAKMAADLKKAGIREVRGKLKTWGGALPFARQIDKTQPNHVGYNPSMSGLNLNYNRVFFEWKRSGNDYSVTLDARTEKYRPEVRVARISVAQRKTPVYTYKDKNDHDSWTVARAALGNGGSRWLPVRRPEAYAAEVFSTFARSHGIVLKSGGALRGTPGGQVLATHKSAALQEILRGMLRYSTNITAELVGMTATTRRKGKPKSLRASAQEMNRWAKAKLGLQDAALVDHSGLGEASRLSTGALAKALAAVHKSGRLKPILKDIPLRHENGKVNKSHPVKVKAKTGTLYFVSSLAGYMTAPDGTELAFAIFAANTKLRAGIDRAGGDRPVGSRSWNRRAKTLQQQLIERWSTVYGS